MLMLSNQDTLWTAVFFIPSGDADIFSPTLRFFLDLKNTRTGTKLDPMAGAFNNIKKYTTPDGKMCVPEF
jgi:hypothetical protein